MTFESLLQHVELVKQQNNCLKFSQNGRERINYYKV